jgi:hypothetical protein
MVIAIIYAIVWWAAEIAAAVYLGYKAAVFGALMSMVTAGTIGWAVGRVKRDEEEEIGNENR